MSTNTSEIVEIKSKLPQNSYQIISKMVNGKYTKGTIRAMFRDEKYESARTMQPEVLEAAKRLVELMNPEAI